MLDCCFIVQLITFDFADSVSPDVFFSLQFFRSVSANRCLSVWFDGWIGGSAFCPLSLARY